MALSEENQTPEFTHDHLRAFIALMLFKVGGSETITLEQLKKFPAKEKSMKVFWDEKKQAFTLLLTKKRKRGVIVPQGIKTVKHSIITGN